MLMFVKICIWSFACAFAYLLHYYFIHTSVLCTSDIKFKSERLLLLHLQGVDFTNHVPGPTISGKCLYYTVRILLYRIRITVFI